MGAALSRVWILNLDAERELSGARGVDPFAALERRPELRARLDALTGEDAVLSREGGSRRGALGRAWCPTPCALSALARRGITPPDAPALEILRRVNHRRFAASLGETLPGGRFVTDEREALALAATPGPSGAWLLKRPLSFAGRGRAIAPPLTDAVRAFIRACVRDEGGVAIEPLVERELDFSLHGHLDRAFELVKGTPTVQEVSPGGAWLGSRVAQRTDLTEEESMTLDREVERVAEALAREGYFGPFGIDAFRYRDASGTRLQPRCEINARYTMGWAIGMGGRRPDRDGSAGS